MPVIRTTSMFTLFLFSFFFIYTYLLSAAPHEGDVYEFRQPDGSFVKVHVWGDEYYQRVESIDGYTLIRNADGWICYAQLNNNRTDYSTTDIMYKGGKAPQALTSLTIPRSIRLNPAYIRVKADAVLRRLEADNEGIRCIRSGIPSDSRGVKGEVKGLTLLVDFSDKPATIAQAELNDFVNKPGYTGNSNNGSVHDYFKEVSCGQLLYTNHVTAYYRALKPKTYYDDANATGTAKELMLEALNNLESLGFDFTTLSVDANKRVLAVNMLYAGSPEAGWANGLWPHSGSISGFSADGISVSRYQMTSIGTSLSIGTFCHENGHMVCKYPDLYDYDSDSKGVGKFCLMCSSGGKNPVPPCAPLRDYYTKWDIVTDITGASPGTVFKHAANSNTSFIYKNAGNANETFYIEARLKKGRSTNIADGGLAIWHFDKTGSNDNQEMTPTSHYRVSLEQADGRCDMEKNQNSGDSTDLFAKNSNDKFNDNSSPNAKWWSGGNSGVDIARISAIGDTMTFTIGDVTSVDYFSKSNADQIVFQGRTLIIYTPAREPVSVTLFSPYGRRLAFDRFTDSHKFIRYDKTEALAAGVYIVNVHTCSRTVSKRFIVQK